MSTMHLSGLRPHPTPCGAMDKAHILEVLAQGTQIETRIREDRAVLVPFALLQGATPLEVAEALGRWTRNELSGAIARWASTLRRAGRIAPAEQDHLLGLNTDDVPERWRSPHEWPQAARLIARQAASLRRPTEAPITPLWRITK